MLIPSLEKHNQYLSLNPNHLTRASQYQLSHPGLELPFLSCLGKHSPAASSSPKTCFQWVFYNVHRPKGSLQGGYLAFSCLRTSELSWQ